MFYLTQLLYTFVKNLKNETTMKKLYTFLFLAVAAFSLNAQTTETFDNFDTTESGSSYVDGTFTGEGGIVWTYGQSRSVSALGENDPYGIDGNGLVLRRPASSFIEATFPNGLSQFSFQYRKAFTSGTPRQLEVIVNGEVFSTTDEFGEGSGQQTDVYTHTLTINQAGAVTVRIKNVSEEDQNRQSTIDNIVWAPADVASVKENNISGLKMYPNPVTGSVLNITSDANGSKTVAIYDVLGKQVVNTVTNSTVNVANFTAGVYIVKITENGKTATRKLVVK